MSKPAAPTLPAPGRVPPPAGTASFCGRTSGATPRIVAALLGAALALPAGAVCQVPLDPEAIRARCAEVHAIQNQSLLFGHVLDARTGTPLPGATVHLAWRTPSGVSDTTVHHVEARATDGAFIFCDVPQRTRLVAWAEALGRTGGRTELWFEGGESERRDLVLAFGRVTGALAGRVVDAETGEPIEGALVRVPATDSEEVTGPGGEFRLRELPAGGHEAEIRHVAYGRPAVPIVVEPGRTTHVEVRLRPEPIEVEPIVVGIEVRPQWLESRGFYDRRARGLGQFVSPEQIERQPWRRFSEVLRTVPGVELRNICTPHCFQVIDMSTATQTACTPTFYMDGRKMTTARERVIDLDALAPAGDLAAVEVYRGISQTPPQFYGRCGSVVIWTKRGAG